MIKIRLLFIGYLKNKYLSNRVELHHKEPVSLYAVLKDLKISPWDMWIINVGSLIVKEYYFLTKI